MAGWSFSIQTVPPISHGQKLVLGLCAFGALNSRKSLRKAKSLFGYFRAFWVPSGIAERQPFQIQL